MTQYESHDIFNLDPKLWRFSLVIHIAQKFTMTGGALGAVGQAWPKHQPPHELLLELDHFSCAERPSVGLGSHLARGRFCPLGCPQIISSWSPFYPSIDGIPIDSIQQVTSSQFLAWHQQYRNSTYHWWRLMTLCDFCILRSQTFMTKKYISISCCALCLPGFRRLQGPFGSCHVQYPQLVCDPPLRWPWPPLCHEVGRLPPRSEICLWKILLVGIFNTIVCYHRLPLTNQAATTNNS